MPDYASIIRRSADLVKKNKWLIVYGLLLAGAGGGGGSGGGGLSSKNTLNLPKEIPATYPKKLLRCSALT